MPTSAHFIFRNFWDFSRKRQKSAIFVAKNFYKNGRKI